MQRYYSPRPSLESHIDKSRTLKLRLQFLGCGKTCLQTWGDTRTPLRCLKSTHPGAEVRSENRNGTEVRKYFR